VSERLFVTPIRLVDRKSRRSLCAGPSNASHFESSSDEIHQPVSFASFPSFSQSYPSAIPLPDRSLGHVTIPCQPEVDQPSTEQKAIPRTRSWHILAIFRDVWRQHRRVKPLGKSPGVQKSIIAIFKSSCEHLPVGILPPFDLLVLCLS
jgi:hypothetical protein